MNFEINLVRKAPQLLLVSWTLFFACGVPPARQVGEIVKKDGKPDVVQVANEDAEMNIAMERARESLDVFRAELAKHDPSASLGLKVRFEDGRYVEHIWLTNVAVVADGFVGEIDNDPVDVSNVHSGDRVSVSVDRVSDWFVVRDHALRGGYTIRVLRSRLSPKEQRVLDESIGATL